MKFRSKPYESEEDYWRIRAFLREVFLRNDRRRISWQASRLDYWRWHLVENVGIVDSIEQATYLWETEGGRIIAVQNNENRNEAVLNVHPDFQTRELEQEMIHLAEQKWGTAGERFFVFAHERDHLRQEILRGFGYSDTMGTPESQWKRDLTVPLPDVVIPEGYTVRAIGGVEELPARSWVSWRAFHPDDPDENYEGWEWNLNWRRSPLYRRDLDIVAVAPNGELVAYTILWYDDVTRTGLFDPVAVMPEHQRRGLARAIMTEAMHRAKQMGATLATVSGYGVVPNATYASILSPQYDLNIPWGRHL